MTVIGKKIFITKKILAHFQAILYDKHTGASIKWEQWERKEVTVNISKDGKFQTQEKLKLVCTEKSGRIKSAVDNLVQIWMHPCQVVDMRAIFTMPAGKICNLNDARILSTSTLLIFVVLNKRKLPLKFEVYLKYHSQLSP